MTEGITDRMKIERFIGERVEQLQNQLLMHKSPSAKAQLARLRRTASSRPGESPDTWAIEFARFPETLMGIDAMEATEGEWAVHLAFTLYAVHQQSQSTGMFRRTNSEAHEFHGLGDGVRQLVSTNQREGQGEQLSEGEMPHRFKALVTAESIEELAYYARQLVTQLRGAGIPLDYAHLAGQLYDFQRPYLRYRVRLEWAREFARRDFEVKDQPTETQNHPDSL